MSDNDIVSTLTTDTEAEYVVAEKSDLTAIADSIRSATGSTATMSLGAMAASVASLSWGGATNVKEVAQAMTKATAGRIVAESMKIDPGNDYFENLTFSNNTAWNNAYVNLINEFMTTKMEIYKNGSLVVSCTIIPGISNDGKYYYNSLSIGTNTTSWTDINEIMRRTIIDQDTYAFKFYYTDQYYMEVELFQELRDAYENGFCSEYDCCFYFIVGPLLMAYNSAQDNFEWLGNFEEFAAAERLEMMSLMEYYHKLDRIYGLLENT